MIERIKDLAAQLASLPGTRTEVTFFPSGAAMLDVWRSGRFFVMEYSPTRLFSVNEVKDGEGYLLGSRNAFAEFEQAAECLRQLADQTAPERAASDTGEAAVPVPPACDQVR